MTIHTFHRRSLLHFTSLHFTSLHFTWSLNERKTWRDNSTSKMGGERNW